MDDNSHKKTARTPSEQKTVDLSDDFIINWKVNMAGRRSFYLRDKQVSCLLINYSKKAVIRSLMTTGMAKLINQRFLAIFQL